MHLLKKTWIVSQSPNRRRDRKIRIAKRARWYFRRRIEKCVPLGHIGKPNARGLVNSTQVKRALRPFRKISGIAYNSSRNTRKRYGRTRLSISCLNHEIENRGAILATYFRKPPHFHDFDNDKHYDIYERQLGMNAAPYSNSAFFIRTCTLELATPHDPWSTILMSIIGIVVSSSRRSTFT